MTESNRVSARVVVVGAGPAGAAAALRLAQNGVPDVVLVDSHDFPRDKTCGSALSPRGIKAAKDLGVWDAIAPKAYPISGIRLVTPGEREMFLEAPGGRTEAVVCLRRDMDYEIYKAAVDAGVRFLGGFHAKAPIMAGARWAGIQAADGREVMAEYTVIANGAHSKWGAPRADAHEIRAIMGWWTGVEFRAHAVEMIFDRMIEPYYGWLFPETESRVNIGITYEDKPGAPKHNARELFQRFLDKYYAERLRDAEQVGAWKGHPILYTYKVANLWSPGRVVIGEAGHMTHPATGEGISFGMRSGIWAADALRDILLRGHPEAVALALYTTHCVTAFTPSFLAGGMFRRLLQTDVLDHAVDMAQHKTIREIMRRFMAHM